MNVVPPDYGAVHQVNLEYLSRVVQVCGGFIYPDSVVGTDSHTTMINGLGILGWGKLTDKFLSVRFVNQAGCRSVSYQHFKRRNNTFSSYLNRSAFILRENHTYDKQIL